MIDAKIYGKKIIGPVVYEYVNWVLQQAIKQELHTLYFLARDGYVLKQAAEVLCRVNGYPIECRYLYCSRMSLRMPTYHFLGEEAYSLLLQGGYHITPYVLMRRLNLDDEERQKVYAEIDVKSENKVLNPEEFDKLICEIKESKSYQEFMGCKSRASYDTTIGYMHQEGLMDNPRVAIVDSGWSGSMQRSLRQLLEHAGYKGVITGFYFGLYNAPLESKDGIYQSYYFDAFTGMKRKVLFDNTWFECVLSAPHGMTIGFRREGDRFIPVMKKDLNEDLNGLILEQISGTVEYVKKRAEERQSIAEDVTGSVMRTYRVLKHAVLFPEPSDLELYGKMQFSDDVSEESSYTLVRHNTEQQLQNYMLIPKLIAKLGHRQDPPINDVFWPYGAISCFGWPKAIWYRWNIIGLQYLRFVRAYFKEKRRVCGHE